MVARFLDNLSATLRKMGFLPSRADHDLWMRRRGDHYEYIATYVDDLLVFSKRPMEIIDTVKKIYELKGVGAPEYYLGSDYLSTNNTKEELKPPMAKEVNGIAYVGHDEQDKHLSEVWRKEGIKTAFSAKTYIKNTVLRLETMVGAEFAGFDTPMSEVLHPELDDTPLLNADRHSQYRSLVGSANWLVTLGRFDVAYATNTLSRFSMQPREGHMKAIIRVFGYLKRHYQGKIMIDPNYPDHANYPTPKYDNWREFYPDAEEHIPDIKEIPEGLGPMVRMTLYKDADHAHDIVTRRSVTGILLFINNTPVKFVSKRQKTVETSTYGSELVAAKQAVELILEYRYKLRMMGANMEESALMLGDNKSVVLNTTMPSSVLKKKHCAVSYHKIREMIACKVLRFASISSEMNYADVLTKPLSKPAFNNIVRPLLFRDPPDKARQKEEQRFRSQQKESQMD